MLNHIRIDEDDGSIYLTAPVLIPGARDCDYYKGEPPLSKEQIRAFKQSYDHYGFVYKEHGLTKDGKKIGTPYKSIILEENAVFKTFDGTETVYPAGTWLLTTHITDEEAISEAMKGYYTGYSPSIYNRQKADIYYEALKSRESCNCAYKDKINSMGSALIKDVPDPVVLSVSLTSKPCLHESKFCELNKMENEDMSLKSKILTAMGMTEEAEVIALKSEVSLLKSEIEAMKTNFDESLRSMQEKFEQTLNEALSPVVAEKAEGEAVAEESEEKDATVEVEEDVEEKKEEDEKEEVIAEKGESKAEPIHDNIAEKSAKPTNIYEALGRNPNGTRKIE